LVAVVAGLAWIASTVAAGLEQALSVAAITRLKVAIVAAFGQQISDPVTASGFDAFIGAGVGVGSISIVTGLTMIEAPVAADFAQAGVRAAITQRIVFIIALFSSRFADAEVQSKDSIAAASRLAPITAGVCRVSVAIVAKLLALVQKPIAAGRRCAAAQAGVGLQNVAIIALLTFLDNAVTAACRLTGVAVIGGVVVAIVTALTRPDDSVTAARLEAVGEAGIFVIIVAVITSLIALIAGEQVRPQNTVAAASDKAAAQAAI